MQLGLIGRHSHQKTSEESQQEHMKHVLCRGYDLSSQYIAVTCGYYQEAVCHYKEYVMCGFLKWLRYVQST